MRSRSTTAHRPLLVRVLPLAVILGLAAAIATVMATGEASATDDPPLQYPFACTAQDHELELIVDNQDGQGVEVRDGDDELLGWSRDCDAETRFWYYAVDEDGELHVVRDHDEGPLGGDGTAQIEDRLGEANLATTTTTEGDEVPYLIRHERGVINRFIYSASMLTTAAEITAGDPQDPDNALWNGRLLFQFQGGVGIGHSQGRYDDRGITGRPDRLSHGYAVIYSTATRTGDHYNLMLGGRTAEMVKDHFVDQHGEPSYTVAIGGSGGGIQQYVYAQNHPDLLDAAIPQRSYPDMTTQTIHVGDCALLDRWMDLEAEDPDFWQDWDNRKLLQGLNSIEGFLGSTGQGLNDAKDQLEQQLGIEIPRQTGSSECLEGWLGLLPLAMNPTFGSESNWDLLGDQVDDIERTHWDDVREVYGTDPETGFARAPWDNVGVQYGLQALNDGDISPEQFLEVNAEVGSWTSVDEMVPEGLPFVSLEEAIGTIAMARGIGPDDVQAGLATGDIPFVELFDPWSSRNARLSPDGGQTPAPRASGDVDAIEAAYASGLVFRGELPRPIPIIDTRDYLEHVLDMHNSHQSFAARQRIADAQGHHDGHLVWFIDTDEEGDAPGSDDVMHLAFDTIAEWIDNLADDPEASLSEAAPVGAADACFSTDGEVVAAGDGVWSGILDDAAPGDCTERYELFTTSRIEAGGPISGDVYKCHAMPADTAVAEGLYGDWQPDAEQRARLRAIHPEGVCDYGLRSVGDPRADVPAAPLVTGIDGGLRVFGAEPGATIELRRDGAVAATVTARSDGSVNIAGPSGTYVAAQVGEDGRGLLSAPTQAGEFRFTDVPGTHPFFQEVTWLEATGLSAGFGDRTFRPTGVVTRQAVAAFFYRQAGSPAGPFDDPGFTDVGSDHPFETEIAWMASQGLTDGFEDGTFRPSAGVTRQATAAFLHRLAGAPDVDVDDLAFTDVDGEHPFATEIAWMVAQDLTQGYDDGSFGPLRDTTRQAIAAFLFRTS